MKSYLSVRQVVQRLNGSVSAKLIYALVGKGKLRSNRSIGKLLIEEDSLLELLRGGQSPEAPSMPPPPRRPRGRPKRETLPLW
ncbi:hypothetical protein [Schlesneria sp. DSM 10557]|uniref:hypothetical protein n=1 Tax=Schlesneria sp. DSM 10557 TaxID=3044399 RepID=UPI0035A12A21